MNSTSAPRPIAAVRARRYAQQTSVAAEQCSNVQDERRSLRRFRSVDTPTAAPEKRTALPQISRRPPVNSKIPRVPQSPQAGSLSRIPRLAASGVWVSEVELQARELVAAKDTNVQLMAELKGAGARLKEFSAELVLERQNVVEAVEHARHLEMELGAERNLTAALEEKIAALEALLANRTAATDPATERFESREALQDTMVSVLSACAAKRPRADLSAAARRDFSIVEAYVASDDARVKRRRSSMLFADLMLPPATTSAGACERCGQLAESMQCLEADNDYYRDANRKLRDAVNDTTSRHNALVRIFEVERARRREIHAAGLAEASRQATHDRIMLDAADPLASRFERSLHIAQPST